MAKRTFQLTQDEVDELRRAYESADDPRTQRRWQAVRLYGSGWSVSDIQEATGCSRESLMRWVRHYRQRGVAGLRSQVRGGNRARLTAQQRAEVARLLRDSSPEQVLGQHERPQAIAFWTLEDIRVLVERRYGVVWQSLTSYRTLLHECGMSVQRVSRRFHSRPSAWAIAEAQAALEKK